MIKNQPSIFFSASLGELWDRLSFYGLQSILVIYFTLHFGFSDAKAFTLYGIYGALSFSLPVLGGYLSDKLLGYKTSIITGYILLIIGNFILSSDSIHLFYLGLSTSLSGIGLFKASNAGLLSQAYQTDNYNQEAGFNFYYIAMNIGAIMGPLSYGIISKSWAPHSPYLLSAAGLILSLLIFCFFSKSAHKKNDAHLIKRFSAFLLIPVCILILYFVLSHDYLFNKLLLLVGLGITAFIYKIIKNQSKTLQKNIFNLLALCVFAVIYYAVALQVWLSIPLFISTHIHAHFFNINIPTASFAALDPLFVILSAPLMYKVFKGLRHKKLHKQVLIGLTLGCVSFLSFSFTSSLPATNPYTRAIFLVLSYFILGAGEISIGPSVLSAVNMLAPKNLQSTFMGLWYLINAFSAYLASLIARLTLSSQHEATQYTHGFLWIALIPAVFSLLLTGITLKGTCYTDTTSPKSTV